MNKYENREDVRDKVDEEGLGYFIMYYTSADTMPDDELKEAFEKAKEALEEFKALLPESEY